MNSRDNERRAFIRGLRELKVKDVPACRKELMEVLGLKTRQSMTAYRNGRMKLDVVKADEIEQIFRKYGVQDCWGL